MSPSRPINPRSSPEPVLRSLPVTNTKGSLSRERFARRVACRLNSHPHLDHDGDPKRLDWREFVDAMQSPYVTRREKAVLSRLHPFFFSRGLTLGIPRSTPSQTGARIETFPCSARSLRSCERILDELARVPQWTKLLADTVVHISPRGFGLEAFLDDVAPGSAGYTSAPPPQVWVAGDVMPDDRTLVHELAHALEMCRPGAEMATNALWQQLFARPIDDLSMLHPRELFAYSAEIYVSGYPEAVKAVSRPLYEHIKRYVGNARVSRPGISKPQAERFMADLFRAFANNDLDLFYEVLNRVPPGQTPP
ncbi:hypothetical protein ACFL6C_03585 [Myxococcota bacterium]